MEAKTLSPNVNVIAFALTVSAAELRLFTEAAKKAALDGALPNRSRWLTETAVAGEYAPEDLAAAQADVEGNRKPIQVTMPPEVHKALKARAKKAKITASAWMRAAALAEAKRLGVK